MATEAVRKPGQADFLAVRGGSWNEGERRGRFGAVLMDLRDVGSDVEPGEHTRRPRAMRSARLVLGVAAFVGMAGCGDPGRISVDAPTADVAVVVCDQEGTRVEPAAVRTQGDGVHFRVQNSADGERMLWSDRFGYEPVPPGVTEMVLSVPPGELRLTCLAPMETDDPEEQAWPYPTEDEWAALPLLDVIDVDGLWTDDTLSCEYPIGLHPDYEWDMTGAPMPEGERGDPVDLVERDLPGYLGELGVIRRGDVVEPAGYEGAPGRVRLVRDGEILAIIRYRPDGAGGWHLGGVEYCEESESAVPEPAPSDETPVDVEP